MITFFYEITSLFFFVLPELSTKSQKNIFVNEYDEMLWNFIHELGI